MRLPRTDKSGLAMTHSYGGANTLILFSYYQWVIDGYEDTLYYKYTMNYWRQIQKTGKGR